MLNRQKAIIEILTRSGRPVTHFQLTKWCFLLRHESASRGGSAFYDFVPYKYGPFSFTLFQEVGKLVQQGYVKERSDSSWQIASIAKADRSKLDGQVKSDIEQLVTTCKPLSRDELIDYVYERHPRFTINSEIRKLQRPARARKAVFTAGYEGISVDAFLDLLLTNGIKRIVDVRNNPIARRYGFHKSTLSRLAGNLDIEYHHVPELGIQSQMRQNLVDADDYNRLFDQYEKTTLVKEKESIDDVADMFLEKPSVLVCMERQACSCHRSRLAPCISERTSLPVEHLIAHAI